MSLKNLIAIVLFFSFFSCKSEAQKKETFKINKTEAEWKSKLTQLIVNPDLRRQIGKNGQKTIKEKYSLESKSMLYKQIFS